MSKGYHIEVKGLSKVIDRLKSYPDKIRAEVDGIMAIETKEMVARAVSDAPVDESFLRQSIQDERLGEMNYTVSASAGYAVYIEFGTKRKFKNPYPSIQSYVANFKGKGGSASGKGFYDEILAWVRRKGFAATSKPQKGKRRSKAEIIDSRIAEEQAAYAIYLHIMRHGVKPQPFFFKHYFTAVANIEKKLKDVVK